MAYFETVTISALCGKYENDVISVFLKSRRFQTARYSALRNTENGTISKKPKNENRPISTQNRDRLNFGHFKAQKKPR